MASRLIKRCFSGHLTAAMRCKKNDDWTERTNFWNNYKNKLLFGPVLHSKLKPDFSKVCTDPSDYYLSTTCEKTDMAENRDPKGCTGTERLAEGPNAVLAVADLSGLFNSARTMAPSYSSASVLQCPRHEDRRSADVPSVTKVIKDTMSLERKVLLAAWEERMILEMGLEQFQLHQARLLRRGRAFHSVVQRFFLEGCLALSEDEREADEDGVLSKLISSLEPVLQSFSAPPVAIESHVEHSDLRYHGFADCVTLIKGDLVLVDWKTSGKTKNKLSMTFDTPIQIAAYIGALNHDPRYEVLVKRGLAVVVYNDGSKADLLEIKQRALESYWRTWLARLQQFRRQQRSQPSETVVSV